MKRGKFLKLKSLKSRLILILIINTAITVILIGSFSFLTTLNIFQKNTKIAISSEVSKVLVVVDNMLNSMRYVSQQLVMEGSVEKKLADYFTKEGQMNRLEALKKLNQQVLLFEASNPNIANVTYYYADEHKGNIKLTTSLAGADMPTHHPLLSQNGELLFYGPHKTNSVASSYGAISMVRRIPLNSIPDTYIYMESGYNKMDDVLTQKLTDLKVVYAIISTQNDVVYSSNNDIVSSGSSIVDLSQTIKFEGEKYYTFSDYSNYGWKLAIFVPRSEYFKEISNWIIMYIVVFVASLIVSFLIAIWIWRMVYMPMRQFNNKLKQVTQENIKDQIESMNVTELDENLEVFEKMKKRIVTLIENVEHEEKEKNKLETKQLYFKINPHFLHNTIDTLKWYAISKGYNDVEKFLSALNKLLLYNMEKNKLTTLESELLSIQDYILLQSIKYDFNFELKLEISEEMLNARLPRFVLQPLVENAINHGLEGIGAIELKVYVTKQGKICIEIIDNGFGMSAEKIEQIFSQQQMSNKGIGLQYVFRCLQDEFGDDQKLTIQSDENSGTSVIIEIPYIRSKKDDQSFSG